MDTYDPAELFMDAGRKLGGPMELPYDPAAVADYIQKKRRMGQVPLFTDDPRLAAREDGFFINTGAGASAQASDPQGYQINKTGNPIIDKYNEAKVELFKHQQAYDADVTKALEATPQARNLQTLQRQLALKQGMGMMANPQEVAALSGQIQIAEQAYKFAKDNLEANPIFAQRKRNLELVSAQLGADAENVKFAEQRRANEAESATRLATGIKAKNIEAQVSPELTAIHSQMSGLPNSQEAVAQARIDGTITAKEDALAVDINEGRAQAPFQYTQQGDPEAGTIMSRYVITNAPPEERAKLKTVADTVNETSRAAMAQATVEASSYLTGVTKIPEGQKEGPLGKLVTAYTTATTDDSKKSAAQSLTIHLYQQKIGAVLATVKQDIIASNPEILRPGADWSSREAEIGNHIVDMIRNDSSPDFNTKMSNAVNALADNSIYGVPEINSAARKMGDVYARRFNADYGKLGINASPGDLQVAQASLLGHVLRTLKQSSARNWQTFSWNKIWQETGIPDTTPQEIPNSGSGAINRNM